jgi:hypothetical protein
MRNCIVNCIVCCLLVSFMPFASGQSWSPVEDEQDRIVEPVPDDRPDEQPVSNREIRSLIKSMIAETELVRMLMESWLKKETPFRDGDQVASHSQVDENTARIEELESRVAAIEEQLKALVTVRTESGDEITAAVEIDTVAGYGDFEVPVGGKVIAIDGVRIRGTQQVNAPESYTTPSYVTGPVANAARAIRIAPVRAAASVFAGRYYIDGDGCTVDRVTGRKVSCPSR